MTLSKSNERVSSTKELKEGLKKSPFDLKEAKKAMLGALDQKGGYKLTKGEALYKSGKLKSVEEMNNAAAQRLDAKDLEAFLGQYGGDKYVKKVFIYGVSKMKRDLIAKGMDFERDKTRGGIFEGLKNYETFEDAFAGGFYTEFGLSFEAIMEKGLSVSEYRQRSSRLRNLEKRVKQEEAKAPEEKPKPEEAAKWFDKVIAKADRIIYDDGYIHNNSFRGVRDVWYHSKGVNNLLGLYAIAELWGYKQFPKELKQRIDEYRRRIRDYVKADLQYKRNNLLQLNQDFIQTSPKHQLRLHEEKIKRVKEKLTQSISREIEREIPRKIHPNLSVLNP